MITGLFYFYMILYEVYMSWPTFFLLVCFTYCNNLIFYIRLINIVVLLFFFYVLLVVFKLHILALCLDDCFICISLHLRFLLFNLV